MRPAAIQYLLLGILSVAVFVFLLFQARLVEERLGMPEIGTGYWLLGLIILLALFNARKRLSMVPLFVASYWLRLHVVGGVLAVALFWVHTGTVWPTGLYEQVFAAVFYLLSASGLVGYLMQQIYPVYLTQSGFEVIYERIPQGVAQIREEAERVVLECTDKAGSDTLARYYLDTLSWFFRKPRFFFAHAVFSRRSNQWLAHQSAAVERYLNDAEREYLRTLEALARVKNQLDVHYALQGLMRLWLLVHVPLAVAVVVLSIWHFLLVHSYAL